MSYNSRTKRLPKIIISQFCIALLMITMALTILFYAEGYRLNLKNFKLTKVGILYLMSDPKDGQIYLDNRATDETLPYKVSLDPGTYYVKVEKDGYTSWSRNIRIESEKVAEFGSIKLFKKDIVPSALDDPLKIELLNAPNDSLVNKTRGNPLFDNGYEIWQNDNLVTRFSIPINSVAWYSDREHIAYQQEDEIRIIEKDGQNDTMLIQLSSANNEKYVFNSKGDEIYFTDQGEYKSAKIR